MTLHIETCGHGPDLALLHGWGLHGGIWEPVRSALAARFTLHIVDLPGHGYSRDALPRSFDSLAREVAARLPADAHLCGWSFGGQVALRIAARTPPRPGRLVLVATTPCFSARDGWEHGVAEENLAGFAKRLGADYEKTLVNFLSLQLLDEPSARVRIRELRSVMFARGVPRSAALESGLAMLRDTDLRAVLPHIGNAALVVQGDRDTIVRAAAGRWLADHLPTATYISVEHCGHIPFLSRPALFVDAVERFLLES